jgi:hypothetical protein
MKCRTCGEEIVFVHTGMGGHLAAFHAGVNLHDRDMFNAGAKAVEPSMSIQYRLRAELEAAPAEEHPALYR